MKRKLTKAEKQARRERKKNTMIIFVHGKQKRVPRPQMIDGMPVEEFIARNADPIWLHQNEMWEYMQPEEGDEDFLEQSTGVPPRNAPDRPDAADTTDATDATRHGVSPNPAATIARNMPGVVRPKVQLFTDGACIGNPGPGGWAFILKHPASGRSKEGSGGEHHSTNNRMEISAVIHGLAALKSPSEVQVFSDSQYVVNAINEWMAKWKKFGWKKSKHRKDHILNLDLWQKLDELMQVHSVAARWVRGHVGHVENERCDVLAVAAADRVAKTPAPPKVVVQPPATPSLFSQ